MKRYLAFFGQTYYPMGGMNDFIGDFDTVEEAKERIEEELDDWSYEWCQVYDTQTKTEVYSK